MKTKESIDDTRKSMDLSPTDSDSVVRATTSIPENKRRRLVRGAMAVAPLVLTLRSGALAAAASCTGARLVNLGEDGVFSPGSDSDVCIETPMICPGYPMSGPGDTKVITTPQATLPVASGGGGYRCVTTGTPPYLQNKNNVAILSSGNANSLIGG